MNLVASANRLYKDKSSELEEKYHISRDIVYLYIDQYECELLVNDEKYTGNIHEMEARLTELQEALYEKQQAMSAKNRLIPYKCYIFTNNIIRVCKALQLNKDNSIMIHAKGGTHTKGQLFKAMAKHSPFIVLNIQSLACNRVNEIEAEGVDKIRVIVEFNCLISGQDIHHLGQTIGRNIEKMEGQTVRAARKDDPEFLLPRLFSYKTMRRAQWEGQIVRNYNLLQCANMAGLLQFDPDEAFKIKHNIISFDIKTAYMSTFINQPIFPYDITCIDIDPKKPHVDWGGIKTESTPYSVAHDICCKLERFEERRQWYYLAVDPNYSGDDPTVLYFLKLLKPFRRNFSRHPDTKLKYVNQDQVFGFLLWDRFFYDEYYSIYMELTFEELLYNVLLLCPDAHIVLMYTKQSMDYLPKVFRDEKMRLYSMKEDQAKDSILRDVVKLYTELTYGKGLQLRDFQADQEAQKAITNETINIAMSLTCCSYTRYRLIHDWEGFTPLYMDSDSVKFEFGPDKNNLLALMQRYEELAKENHYDTAEAGYPDSDLGQWHVDGVYDHMIFLQKKCYIGYKNDASIEVKLAGCDKKAAEAHFKKGTLDLLIEIAESERLTIYNGKKQCVILPNNEYQYYKCENVTYEKKRKPF